jgi:hypothetical protein
MGDNGRFGYILVRLKGIQLQDFGGHQIRFRKHFAHTSFVCE